MSTAAEAPGLDEATQHRVEGALGGERPGECRGEELHPLGAQGYRLAPGGIEAAPARVGAPRRAGGLDATGLGQRPLGGGGQALGRRPVDVDAEAGAHGEDLAAKVSLVAAGDLTNADGQTEGGGLDGDALVLVHGAADPPMNEPDRNRFCEPESRRPDPAELPLGGASRPPSGGAQAISCGAKTCE